MHLVLLPVGLPLLLLDLCPARGVEVLLDARLLCVSALLSPLLLRGLRMWKQLAHGGRLLPVLPLPRLPLPAHLCTLCEGMSRESLRRPAPVLVPPVLPDLRLEKPGRIVEPVRGRAVLMAGLVARALAPLPVRGQAVESVVGGTRLDRCLHVCGRGFRTAIGPVRFARAQILGMIGLDLRIALGVTSRGLLTATGLGESVRVPLLVREVAVTACSHAIPLVALVTARGHAYNLFSPLTVRGQGIEVDEPDVSCGRVWRQLRSPRLPLFQKRQLQWLLLLSGVLWQRFRLLCRISPGFS